MAESRATPSRNLVRATQSLAIAIASFNDGQDGIHVLWHVAVDSRRSTGMFSFQLEVKANALAREVLVCGTKTVNAMSRIAMVMRSALQNKT